jgi:N12 class adenine-specific DNA methylase
LSLELRNSLDELKADKLAKTFRKILLLYPYQLSLPYERFYQVILYYFLKIFNFKIDSEVSVAEGDIDFQITFPNNRIFVIELKYEKDGTEDNEENKTKKKKVLKPEEIQKLLTGALKRVKDQIKAKNYDAGFIIQGKTVHKVAVGIVGRTEVAVEIY